MKRLMRWLQLPGIGLMAILAASGCKKVAPEIPAPSQKYYQTSAFAGGGGPFAYGGYLNGLGTKSLFNNIAAAAVDGTGNVYAVDQFNFRIRKITPDGVVSTFAGSGINGYVDGTGAAVQFGSLQGLAIDATDNLYVVDYSNNVIRKITPTGVVSTFAGTGQPGYQDGPVAAAKFNSPFGIAVDKTGSVYVGDGSAVIRKISTAGIVSTYAGVLYNTARNPAPYDGPADQLKFGPFINSLTTDPAGNVYAVDQLNNYIYQITPDGHATTWAGNGALPSADVSIYKDGFGPSASFNGPSGIASDDAGNLYISDSLNQRIRKISTDRIVSTLIGNGQKGETIGNGADVQLNTPSSVASNHDGSIIYYSEPNRVCKIEVLTTSDKPQNNWNNPQTWGNAH
ncbi:NHL domain-containing protein [Pedobacter cryoconitis]|uniref:NHL repeat-containing protein n=1 Tax=Pedobacter cryoconitis TaxID=188932 RepID=A0A327T6U6_9SPHI|nr:hypothetical protein [Pedobacter cryoconitis]RAJ35453.1 NHL repeat-containing protein [Pedobacter cryoconitis]